MLTIRQARIVASVLVLFASLFAFASGWSAVSVVLDDMRTDVALVSLAVSALSAYATGSLLRLAHQAIRDARGSKW